MSREEVNSMRQVFFSKLIDACERDWIPEQDDVLFGERCMTKAIPGELKRLVYRHRSHPRPAKAGWSVKTFQSLLSRQR